MKGHLEAQFLPYFAVKVGESVGEWQGSGSVGGGGRQTQRRGGGEEGCGLSE